MVTSFGKILRKIRIDNNEILKNMAEKLNVTSSFLSAVENGKKRIPNNWLNEISCLYDLNSSEIENLEFAFSETNESIKISFEGLNLESKKLAFSFARKLNELDDAEIESLKNLLRKEKQQNDGI